MRSRILPYIVLPVFIILFATCNQKQGNEVIFKKATINSLTDLFDHIQTVRLDHGDSILIGGNPLVIQKDSSFYLVDKNGQKKIFRFALDGRFLNMIGTKGDGPGEYVNMQKVLVDEKEDDVFVLSAHTDIYRYSKKGIFKGRVSCPDLQIQDFIKQDSIFWVHAWDINYDTLRLLRTNLHLQALDTLTVPLPKVRDPNIHRLASAFFHFNSLDNKICFSTPPYPGIYEIEKKIIREKVRFRFVPKEYASWDELENLESKVLLDHKSLTYVVSFYENESFLFVNFQCGGRKQGYQFVQAIQEKHSGQWKWTNESFSESNLKQIPWYIGRLCGFSGDEALICYLPAPQHLVAYEAVKDLIVNPELFSEVDEEMDMYLFLCHLKSSQGTSQPK